MSNIYRYALPAVSHYQMPRALDQFLNSIRFEELRLLHLVHSEAERYSRSEIALSTQSICRRTGINKSNIGKARQGLVNYGLLMVRQEGRQYIYVVCDPGRKTAVADRTSLKTINFDHVSESVLTQYIESILKETKPGRMGITGHCPFPTHNDSTASFTMDTEKGGKWWCRGCSKSGSLIDLEIYLSENTVGATISPDVAHKRVRDKLRALGMGKSASGRLAGLSDLVYPYVDEEGEVITETVRRNGNKSNMYQRRPHPKRPGRYLNNTDGCRNVLYNLPQILEAGTVIVVEGESDADRLSKLGLRDDLGDLAAVTTCRNGAGGWLREHTDSIRNKRVILCGDNDADGRGLQHMLQVKASLEAAQVKALIHIQLPLEFRDISHYLASERVQKFINQVGPDWLESIEDDVAEI